MIEPLWTQGAQGIEGWKDAPLPDLVIHIVELHHMPARVEMGRLETLIEEAVLLEGEDHPALLAVRDEIGRFCRDFRAHMALEERHLFPRLLETRDCGRAERISPLAASLEDEHGAETDLFLRLRDLSGGSLPAPGFRNLRARLNNSLRSMEKSLQVHLMLETQILFRRAL